jgi:hypothetical protein
LRSSRAPEGHRGGPTHDMYDYATVAAICPARNS